MVTVVYRFRNTNSRIAIGGINTCRRGDKCCAEQFRTGSKSYIRFIFRAETINEELRSVFESIFDYSTQLRLPDFDLDRSLYNVRERSISDRRVSIYAIVGG